MTCKAWTWNTAYRLADNLLFVGLLLIGFTGVSAGGEQIRPLSLKTSANNLASHSSGPDLASLPAGAQGPVSAALGKDDSKYWVRGDGGVFRTENSGRSPSANFTARGVELQSHGARWQWKTQGYGRGENLRAAKSATPGAKANRVEYRRGPLTEWYENGPMGLEQGFTIAQAPAETNGQPLTVALALTGDLAGAIQPNGTAIAFSDKNGRSKFRYSGLNARDASGRELHSWMELRGQRLLLRVDDKGARYPVVIDPFLQAAALTSSDGTDYDTFGSSVAVSGGTIVVGAPNHAVGANLGQGAAYVFVQSGNTWIQQAELIAPDGAALDSFGLSVGVSVGVTEGRIVVGAPYHSVSNEAVGAAYVFVLNGSTWNLQNSLNTYDGVAGDFYGYSVAVCGDTILVGAPQHALGQGKVYVWFHNSDLGWAVQQELFPSVAAGGSPAFGYSVAVSGNGYLAVVGAPFQNANYVEQGAAYGYYRNGSTWVNLVGVVSPSDGAGGDLFGSSVAIDDATVVVGAPNKNLNTGAAYVYGGLVPLAEQEQELTAPDGAVDEFFGASVAVSGTTAVVGSPQYNNPFGGLEYGGPAYVYLQSGTAWSLQQELTSPGGVGDGDEFALSVAVSGSTVLVGAPDAASAYVFAPAVTTITPAALSFGNAAIHDTTAAKAVTLKNTGTAPLTISGVATSGDFAVSSTTCGATLAAGKTCKANVTFTPTMLAAETGTLSFTDSGTGSPQTEALSGTGIVQAALTPVSATYAKQKVGTTSAAKTFTLTNNRTVALSGITISASGDFAVSATTCSTSLNAKAKCTVNVTFQPTTTGSRTGQLSISDSASNTPQTSHLSGTGD